MLPRSRRLGSSRRVARVFQQGVRGSRPAVAARAVRRDGGPSLFAIVAARQLGSRPARNRARRRVAHALREMIDDVAPGLDIVLIARPDAAATPFSSLKEDVRGALVAAGALEGNGEAER